jgi:hypothetical protein
MVYGTVLVGGTSSAACSSGIYGGSVAYVCYFCVYVFLRICLLTCKSDIASDGK